MWVELVGSGGCQVRAIVCDSVVLGTRELNLKKLPHVLVVFYHISPKKQAHRVANNTFGKENGPPFQGAHESFTGLHWRRSTNVISLSNYLRETLSQVPVLLAETQVPECGAN